MDGESGLQELADDARVVVHDQDNLAVLLKFQDAFEFDQPSRSLVTLRLHQQFAWGQVLFGEPSASQLGEPYRPSGEPHDVVVDGQVVRQLGTVR